jgi:hypothetical protein
VGKVLEREDHGTRCDELLDQGRLKLSREDLSPWSLEVAKMHDLNRSGRMAHRSAIHRNLRSKRYVVCRLIVAAVAAAPSHQQQD